MKYLKIFEKTGNNEHPNLSEITLQHSSSEKNLTDLKKSETRGGKVLKTFKKGSSMSRKPYTNSFS